MRLIFAQGTHTGPRLNHLGALRALEEQLKQEYRGCKPSSAKRIEKRIREIKIRISNYYKRL